MRESLLGQTGYAYTTLSDAQRSAYLDICDRIRALEAIDCRDYPELEPAEVSRVLVCIDMDHPEFFWMDSYMSRLARMVVAARSNMAESTDAAIENAWDSATDMDGDGEMGLRERIDSVGAALNFENPAMRWAIVKKLKPSRRWNHAEIERIQRVIEERVEECRATIPPGANDYQIYRACFEYVCRTTSYSVEDALEKQDVRSVFLEGDSVCKGYAEALQYLLLSFGVPCFNVWGMVEGTAGRVYTLHAWNYVWVNGMWNVSDPTLADYDLQRNEEMFAALPSWYAKEVLDYSQMSIADESHVPIDLVPLPATGSTGDYFMREGTEVRMGDASAIEDAVIRVSTGEERFLCFRILDGDELSAKWLANAAGRIARTHATFALLPKPAPAHTIRLPRHANILALYFE